MSNQKKYLLNKKTKTLHIIGKCRYSKGYFAPDYKTYNSFDEANDDTNNYHKRCKLCFGGE